MTYNRSEIMTAAHNAARANMSSDWFKGKGWTYAMHFAAQMRRVWADAKCRMAQARRAAEHAAMSEADRIRMAINDLENKDRWSQVDYARMDELRASLRSACERETEEKAAAELAQKRKLIESAGGRFASVVFTKKDGSRRQMRIQPAKLKYQVKGDAASEPAQRAVETRKARHPNLLPVWDVEASAPRSVNLATVSRIAVNGVVHEFRI